MESAHSLANLQLSPAVLEQALHATDIMVVLTDPFAEDNPIVWANDYFCQFTGYSRDEVLGRNCRFLQGRDRDQPGIRKIREAVEAVAPVHVLLRNYKKDGTPFENDLFISPVRADRNDPASPLRYFIGVQNDSTARMSAERELVDREREIEETAENERERFGMDLHDGLGQELSGISLLLRALADRLESEASAHAGAANRTLELVESALRSARDMARGLNPVDASPHGLGDALRTLCAAVGESTPGVTVHARVESVSFSDRREARHLFRIAQEALSNAVRHAGAREVVVTLHRAPGAVHLEVRDDGRGIDEATLRAEGRADESPEDRAALARRGMGLYGMRHRADLIGARLTVARQEGGGTVVRCVLPWEEAGAEPAGFGRGQRDRTGEQE